MSKKIEGAKKQNELRKSQQIIVGITSKDIDKLTQSETAGLLKAICLQLGICDVNGKIGK